MSAFPNFDLVLPILMLDKKMDEPGLDPSTQPLLPEQESSQLLSESLAEDNELKAKSPFLKRRRERRNKQRSKVSIIMISVDKECYGKNFRDEVLDEILVCGQHCAAYFDACERWTSAVTDAMVKGLPACTWEDNGTLTTCRSFVRHFQRLSTSPDDTAHYVVPIVITPLIDRFARWVIEYYNDRVMLVQTLRPAMSAGFRLSQTQMFNYQLEHYAKEKGVQTMCNIYNPADANLDGRQLYRELFNIESDQ